MRERLRCFLISVQQRVGDVLLSLGWITDMEWTNRHPWVVFYRKRKL